MGGGGGGEVGGDGQGLQPVEGVPKSRGLAVGEPLAAPAQLLGECVAAQAFGRRGEEEAGESVDGGGGAVVVEVRGDGEEEAAEDGVDRRDGGAGFGASCSP